MWESAGFVRNVSGSELDNKQIASGTGSASSAKLSLEISQLVSRALAGEAIDMSAEGDRLAGRFPELGMSGMMIGSAIARSLSMVGAIRSGAGPVDGLPADTHHAADSDAGEAGADLAGLIGTVGDPILVLADADGDAAECADSLAEISPAAASNPGVVARRSRNPVAAFRRALFRD